MPWIMRMTYKTWACRGGLFEKNFRVSTTFQSLFNLVSLSMILNRDFYILNIEHVYFDGFSSQYTRLTVFKKVKVATAKRRL